MNSLFPDLYPSAGRDPSAPRDRVFFGVLPPAGVARRAHDLAGTLMRYGRTDGALRPEGVLHVSLMPMGKQLAEPQSSGLIEALLARAGAVKQRPFAVSLNRVEAWGRARRKRPVVAVGGDGIVGLETLHRNLAAALGLRERANFNPHMTLLYGRGPAEPLPIAPIGWTVREFVLIHSFVGLTRYKILGRLPLSA